MASQLVREKIGPTPENGTEACETVLNDINSALQGYFGSGFTVCRFVVTDKSNTDDEHLKSYYVMGVCTLPPPPHPSTSSDPNVTNSKDHTDTSNNGGIKSLTSSSRPTPDHAGELLVYMDPPAFNCYQFMITNNKIVSIGDKKAKKTKFLFVWYKGTGDELRWYVGSPCYTGDGKEGDTVKFESKEITSNLEQGIKQGKQVQAIEKSFAQMKFYQDRFVWYRTSDNDVERNFEICKDTSIPWYWKKDDRENRSREERITLTSTSNMAHFEYIETGKTPEK